MATQLTTSEVQKREEELRVLESQAQEAQRTPIPERKFGAGVTVEEQQLAYQRRAEGSRVLGEVKAAKKEIQVYKARQAEIRSLERQQADYQRGFDLAFSSHAGAVFAVAFSDSAALKEGYKAGRAAKSGQQSRNEYLGQINKLKSEGLTPVYINNKLVGFEDAIRQQSIGLQEIPNLSQSDLARYEKAGAITTQKVDYQQDVLSKLGIQFQSTKEGVVASYQPIQGERYKPVLGKVEKAIQYPFEKVASLEERYLFNQEKDFIFAKNVKPSLGLTIFSFGTLSPQTLRIAGEFASYPVYGARRVEELYFDPTAREEFKELPTAYKALEIGNIGLSLYAGGSLAKSAYKKALEPISIKEFGRETPKTFAETKIYNIKTEGRPITLAEFEVTSVSKPIKVLEVPNYIAKLRGFKKLDTRLDKYSLEELRLLAPEGKLREISPLKISQSKTEPFLVQDGKIISSARTLRKPGVLSARASISETGATRISGKELSVLSGRTYPEVRLSSISKSRSELPDITKKQLEELEKIPNNYGLDIRKVQEPSRGIKDINAGSKFSPGELELFKIAKITNKEIKLTDPGRRISRADVLTIQESLGKIEFQNKGALKEIEFLKEDIAAVDVTFPRLRSPRKIAKIEGRTAVFDIYPEMESVGNIGSKIGKGDQSLKTNFKQENQKVIQEAVGNVALKQIKSLETKPIKATMPKINLREELQGQELSAFAGKGAYELTQPRGAMPGQLRQAAPDMFIKTKTNVRVEPLERPKALELNKSTIGEQIKELTKEQSKSEIKNITKNITKGITKNLSKTQTKTQSKTITKALQKAAPKSIPTALSGVSAKIPSISKPKKAPGFLFKLPSGKGESINTKGIFKVFGKRQGKFKEIGTGQTLSQAKNLFLKFQKGSLGRSAYVETGGKKLSLKELKLGKEFRKSKANEKIIVQKVKFSLGTKDELREIQAARRKL